LRAERRRKMKFLTITSLKDTISVLPPATSRQLLEATAAWVNEQKKAGVILEIYAIPGWRRTIGISERESAEDLAQALGEIPLAAFMNFEVYPLADWHEAIKAQIEALKRAEKLFPAAPR